MTAITAEIEDKIDELLSILDTDIQHIHETVSKLDELRSLVIRRDEVSLLGLLEAIKAQSQSYAVNELKRQAIRKELAIALGCNLEQVTLSGLEQILKDTKKAQIADRKVKLKTLTEKLKREHLSTTLLLSDCARFNSLVLRSIFDFGKATTVTYGSNGSARRQSDTTFVNLQF